MKALFSLTILNLLILLFLFFRIGVPLVNSSESIMSNTDSIAVFLASQANQFALMQVLLSILGIGIAVAGFWGYFEIKRLAENKAADTIKTEAPRLLEKFSREEIQRLIFEEKTKSIAKKNSHDIFQEGITRIQKDPMEIEEAHE